MSGEREHLKWSVDPINAITAVTPAGTYTCDWGVRGTAWEFRGRDGAVCSGWAETCAKAREACQRHYDEMRRVVPPGGSEEAERRTPHA